MDRRDGEHLPDDLRGIADGLRECRTEPTPLQLDELKQRSLRQAAAAPPRNAGLVWRRRIVAILVTAGLMTSTTTSVALATGGLSGNDWLKFKWAIISFLNYKKDSGQSQYCDEDKHDGSDSNSYKDSDSRSDCDSSDSHTDRNGGSDADSDSNESDKQDKGSDKDSDSNSYKSRKSGRDSDSDSD